MSNKKILSRVYEIISGFNKQGITLNPETTFSVDLDLDSLTVMDLVAVVEDEYDIILPLNMLPDLENIQQLANAVTKIVNDQ